MPSRDHRLTPYSISVLLVVLTTVFGEFVKKDLEPTNLVMFYLLAVVVSAIWWGRGPAVAASILSVLAFDYFLIPPYHTFRVTDIQYVFTFAAFLIVGLVVSTLASKAREQAIRAETEKLQTALLNSISHDLRTPLVSITGALSTLLENPASLDEATRKDLLENAHEEAGHLNRLVGNLLDMTRVEAGTLKVTVKLTELRDVVGAALQQLKDKTEKREVRIRIPHGMPEVPMDFSLMMRVFVNLVDNALKYSPPDTPVDITAEMSGDRVRIAVRDEGFGVPPDDLKRIFDKFYRAVKPKKITGTGLGLSICKGIVEAHRGSIRAENNPGRGTTFVVTLPVTAGRA